MSKQYKKITKSISLNESKICQELKNPFIRIPKKIINTPVISLLNTSLVEKSHAKKDKIALNETIVKARLNDSMEAQKQTKTKGGSNDYTAFIGRYLNKAMQIDDFMQKEFAIMTSIGPVPMDKLSHISIEKQACKKLLVMDLENVLIHCIDFANSELYSKIDINPKYIKTISYYNPNKKSHVFNKIIIRPYLDFLMSILKGIYTIVVFSNSDRYFTESVAQVLANPKPPFDKILCNEYCIKRNDQYIKDLRVFSGWNIKDIVFVGNSLTHFMCQLDNGILVKSFIGSDEDTDLKELSSTLVRLSKEPDVRKHLRTAYGYTELYSLFLDSNEESV